MSLSVVIPAFNEALNIVSTVQEAANVIRATRFVSDYEFIVVDDHSSDATFQAVSDMNDPKVKCIRLSRRCGSHTALRAGMSISKGDYVLVISADGQDDPNTLGVMIDKLDSGANVVWAYRKNRESESWLVRKTAEAFYGFLSWIGGTSDASVDLSQAGFFILDSKVKVAINSCKEQFTALFGLILWSGFRHDHVYYDRRARKFGKSKWNFKRRLDIAKDWIVAFSGVPLRLMTFLGSIFAFGSFIYGILVVRNFFTGRPIEGWSSLMVVVLLIGGIQMIMLGVIGEYLWHTLQESRQRPLYFIERQT